MWLYSPPSRAFEEGRPRRSIKCLATFRNRRGRGGQTPDGTTLASDLVSMAKRDINLINTPPLKNRRRELRNNPTPAEAILWKYLQRRQILGKKFRRQYSIGRYIVDFFCVECDIAIELDGAPHFGELGSSARRRAYDFFTGTGDTNHSIRESNRLSEHRGSSGNDPGGGTKQCV